MLFLSFEMLMSTTLPIEMKRQNVLFKQENTDI